MKSVRLLSALGLFAVLLAQAGCVKRAASPAQLGPDSLYAQASAAYEAGKHGRAIPLLEFFVQQHHGDPRAPEARLRLGHANLARRDYVTAVTHYQQLINDFPASPLGREARFGICEAYNRLSPKPALDQEYTRSAILHCESISEYYPGSEEAQKAQAYVTELRRKLAQKSYDTGVFYLKRRLYDSAVIYFTEVVDNFPQTALAPAALARLVETYTTLGYVEEAQAARERLQREYPDSPEAQALRG